MHKIESQPTVSRLSHPMLQWSLEGIYAIISTTDDTGCVLARFGKSDTTNIWYHWVLFTVVEGLFRTCMRSTWEYWTECLARTGVIPCVADVFMHCSHVLWLSFPCHVSNPPFSDSSRSYSLEACEILNFWNVNL